jgi:hypothetical protein
MSENSGARAHGAFLNRPRAEPRKPAFSFENGAWRDRIDASSALARIGKAMRIPGAATSWRSFVSLAGLSRIGMALRTAAVPERLQVAV